MSKGPVLFDLSETSAQPSVAEAAPVPDLTSDAPPTGQAMQVAAQIAARKPSRLARWFWALLSMLLGAVVSIAAYDFAASLIARNPTLGYGVTALTAAFVLVLSAIAIRELAAFGRLSRLDGLRHAADAALANADLKAARDVTNRLESLYKNRADTRWGRDRLADLRPDQLDAAALLSVAETELLGPLDAAAAREVEAAARQVATVTALVPLALADVVAALTANLRMIRRIAEVYGGRSGVLGGWRLTRAVMAHLVATGAVAVGDDMLEPILGGSILGKLSRRFGEGLVNGALTARVGVAAMEVCRPLPFTARHQPRARDLVKRALTGLFSAK